MVNQIFLDILVKKEKVIIFHISYFPILKINILCTNSSGSFCDK